MHVVLRYMHKRTIKTAKYDRNETCTWYDSIGLGKK